ncbi:Indigoidine synthase A like protein-domain-containing protein [Scleroderma yunnanense]
MDVSADLHELARCPVGLVSAGVKSILDIGRTLEYLETLGVPVVSYGESKDFPAFYTRQSGHQAPWNVTDPAQAAGILYTHWQLGMTNGALFAVPIPEKYEAAGASIQRTVELAVRESEELGISKSGKEVTPWLLNRVRELTKGGSLDSNVALIQNTALVGGKIAVEFVKLAQEGKQDLKRLYLGIKQQPALSSCMDQVTERLSHLDRNVEAIQQNKASIVVVGCAAVDITSKVEQGSVVSSKTTHPGILSLTLGGVGRNIAEAAHRILSGFKEHSNSTLLLAPVGEDIFGKLIVDLTRSTGMRTDGLRSVPGMRSAVCNLFLDAQGGLQNGVADMDLPQLWQGTDVIPILQHHQPQFLVLDGNLSTEMMTAFVKEVAKSDIQIFFEPTSVAKSTRIFPAIAANFGHSLDSVISYASPNLLELRHMYEEARNTFDLMSHDHWWKVVNGFALEPKFRIALDHLAKKAVSEENTNLGDLAFLVDKGVIQMAINLLPFFQHLVIKCGELGVVIVMRLKNADASAWLSKQNDPQGRHVIAYSQASVSTIVVQHFPPLHSSPSASENTTGVGDSLVGALLAMLVQKPNAFLDPATLKSVVDVSQEAAIMTLQSSHAVSPLLSSLSVGLIPGKTSLPPA